MAHPNEELLRRGFRALCARDEKAVGELFGGDVTLHYPGRSVLAGDYRGPEEVVAWVRRGMQVAGRGSRTMLSSVHADDQRGVVLYVTSHELGGQAVHERSVAIVSFKDGKVVEVWVTPTDLSASDERLAEAAR